VVDSPHTLLPEADFGKLKLSIDWSIQRLQFQQEKRKEAIQQYVGSHYADGGAENRVPVNFIELAISIYTRQLSPRNPRCQVNAANRQLRRDAANFTMALNQVPREVGLAHNFRDGVMEAMFGKGVFKVGICTTGTYLGHEYGEPFVDVITLDDYFYDKSARKRNSIQYEGNDYWVELDDLMEDLRISDSVKEALKGDDYVQSSADQRSGAGDISGSKAAQTFGDRVHLRDVWIPRLNLLVTYAVTSGILVKAVSWDGVHTGPYIKLSFGDVPDNLDSLPPVSIWRDMHELGNVLFRKLAKQAMAQKTVLGFPGGDDEAVGRFKTASDGDGITYNGRQPERLEAGGVNNVTLAFFLQVRDLYSYFAGNLDSLGGLAPTTETVGQDRLLSDAASARLKEMAGRVVDCLRQIFETLGWYEWTDPVRRRILRKPLPGRDDIYVETEWGPETRRGDYFGHNFDIDVFSLQDDSPAERLSKITMIWERFVVPALPLIQAGGGSVDFEALFALIAQYANIPEIKDLVKFQASTVGEMPVQGDPEPSRMPTHTTRTYERVNRPGATRQGKDSVLAQLLMGGSPQASEKAVMGRAVS